MLIHRKWLCIVYSRKSLVTICMKLSIKSSMFMMHALMETIFCWDIVDYSSNNWLIVIQWGTVHLNHIFSFLCKSVIFFIKKGSFNKQNYEKDVCNRHYMKKAVKILYTQQVSYPAKERVTRVIETYSWKCTLNRNQLIADRIVNNFFFIKIKLLLRSSVRFRKIKPLFK